jgi:hypothetical protein
VSLQPYALTDWATVKSLLNLSDDQQSFTELLINSASLKANNLTNRYLKAQVKEELFDGQNLLILSDYPVNTLTDIRLDPLRAFAENTIISSSNYVLYEKEGIVKILYTIIPRLPLCLKVTYNAGFNPVPEDLIQAVIEIVKVNIGRIQGNILGVRTQRIDGNISASYELEIPISARQVFESYRSIR